MDSAWRSLEGSSDFSAQCKFFEQFDQKASENFGEFIKELAQFWADGNKEEDYRKMAAQEICYHITNKSKVISEMQRKNWFSIKIDTRNEIKSLLLKGLEHFNSKEMVNSIRNVIVPICLFDTEEWTDCFDEIFKILSTSDREYTKIECFQILDDIRNEEHSKKKKDDLMAALVIGLGKRDLLVGETYHDLRCAALALATNLVKSISETEFAEDVLQILVDHDVLKSDDEEVRVSAVNLLTEIVLVQIGNDNDNVRREEALNFWKRSFEEKSDLFRALELIRRNSKPQLAAVDHFFKTLDSIN